MSKVQIPRQKIVIKDFDGDNVPVDFDFPSIGIEDIDRSVFELFNKTLQFEVESKGVSTRVPVIFATGERFALTRRKNPIRDRNNTNILPLISIVRKDLDIGSEQGGKKTPISFRSQPNYTIKKRLSEKDRTFQNLLNKDGLRNQDNVATNNNFLDTSNNLTAQPGKTASRRDKSNLKFSSAATISLKPQINSNVYEIIQVPYPYFIAMTYDVTFWCQYMQQGNQMIEYLLNKLDVPGGEFSIKTDSGFELVAFIGSSITFNNNFDSMTDDERIIKYNFSLTVPGYLLNSDVPGLANQTRTYLSAPMIDFSYEQSNSQVYKDYQPETDKEKFDKHVLSDITNADQFKLKRGESNGSIEQLIKNPFSGEENTEYLRVKNVNARTGETIVSSTIVKEIDRQHE